MSKKPDDEVSLTKAAIERSPSRSTWLIRHNSPFSMASPIIGNTVSMQSSSSTTTSFIPTPSASYEAMTAPPGALASLRYATSGTIRQPPRNACDLSLPQAFSFVLQQRTQEILNDTTHAGFDLDNHRHSRRKSDLNAIDIDE